MGSGWSAKLSGRGPATAPGGKWGVETEAERRGDSAKFLEIGEGCGGCELLLTGRLAVGGDSLDFVIGECEVGQLPRWEKSALNLAGITTNPTTMGGNRDNNECARISTEIGAGMRVLVTARIHRYLIHSHHSTTQEEEERSKGSTADEGQTIDIIRCLDLPTFLL